MQRLSRPEAISARPKRPVRLTAEVKSAATQISGMYGMQAAVRMATLVSTGRRKAQSKAPPIPSKVRPIIPGKIRRSA